MGDAILCAPSDCMGVVANVDSLVVSQISGCAVIDSAATDPKTYPINRLITPTFTVDGGTSLKTGATTFKNDACQYTIARHVITLDSMPTASAHNEGSKSLEYTSPVGSCSVSETTKGT